MKELLQKIYDRHDIYCNQKYDDYLPYSFHLKAVVAQTQKYLKTTKLCNKYSDVQAQFFYSSMMSKQITVAAAGHDLIEDARMTYNDVVKLCKSKDIADIIYCCSEELGHNREERHSEKYFERLINNRVAVFVKLCDIIANVTYSILTNSTMFEKYKSEYPRLKEKLFIPREYDQMWIDLEQLLSISI